MVGMNFSNSTTRTALGARMEMPKYLLRQGRFQATFDLFTAEKWEGTFYAAQHPCPLTLLHLDRRDEAIEAIESPLGRPNIAQYLLDPDALVLLRTPTSI